VLRGRESIIRHDGNLPTAKSLGLTIPQMPLRANEVIERPRALPMTACEHAAYIRVPDMAVPVRTHGKISSLLERIPSPTTSVVRLLRGMSQVAKQH